MKKSLLLFACMASTALSCTVDPDFVIDDFDKVDTGVTIFGSGIEVPIGKTEKIYLGELMKAIEDSTIREFFKEDKDGNYSLNFTGRYDLTDIVDSFNFGPQPVASPAPRLLKGGAPLYAVSRSVNYECKGIVFLDSQAISELPKEIRKIKNIIFEGANANAKIVISGLPTEMEFSIKNIVLTLPAFIYTGDGTNKITIAGSQKVENNKPLNISVPVSGIRDINLEGVTEVKGDISFTADLVCETPSVIPSEIPGEFSVSVQVAIGDGKTFDEPGEIVVRKAIVTADYHIDQTAMESFGEVPEFLRADSVDLGISPVLDIKFRTNCAIPLKGRFEIVPYRKGAPVTAATVVINGIRIPVSENPEDTLETRYVIGAGVTPGGEKNTEYIDNDLSGLVCRVPDSLAVRIKADIDKTDSCIFYPSAKYVCGVNYTLNAPLKFKEGMKICYSEMLPAEDISEIFSVGRVRLFATVINTLPVGVRLELIFLDAEEKAVPGFEKLELRIKPGNGKDETPQDTGIDFNYTGKDAGSIKSVRINFRVESVPGIYIRADQYVQVLRLSGILPEGITIDTENE